ncbi:MAG: Ig-like domain-containing protein [Lachnospiraceae bacterium]|nr:Ig-like domain-containing protein [Lachnospiraceae bacterium]
MVKKTVRLACVLCLFLLVMLSVAGVGMRANAAASTEVKTLAVGKSYSISGYSRVTSSKTSVATATKSGSKYKIKAIKAGTATLTCYNSNGTAKKKIYLLVTDSESVSYDTSRLTLVVGKTKTAAASVPSGCTVKYSSSKKSVATVNSKGKITAVKTGAATITAKVYYKDKLVKTLKRTVSVVKYSYDNSALALTKGETKTVRASVASGLTVKYSSSKKSVATVSSSGKITAVKTGTATIKAKVYNGKKLVKTYSKKITVVTCSFDNSAIVMSAGETKSVAAAVSGKCSVKYSSSDGSVASVSSSGKVTAKGSGSAKITVKIYVGDKLLKTYSKKITVKAAETESIKAEQKEPTQSETTQSETVQSEAMQTEAAQTETVQTEATQTEATQTETVQTETVQTEAAQTESIQKETVEQADSETAEETETRADEASAVSEDAPLSITGVPTDTEFHIGDTFTLGYDADDVSSVAWLSSDSSVATVSNGTVTCLAAGTVIITCNSSDDSCGSVVTLVIYGNKTETLPDEWQ